MELSTLQNKDVVSLIDGRKIGKIIDVKIMSETGTITNLVVEKSRFFIHLFGAREEQEISWQQIKKIGEDVILVNLEIKNENNKKI